VARCLETLWQSTGITPRFALVAPAEVNGTFAYTLYIEADAQGDLEALAALFDTLLADNFHYDYCRRLGQLAPARVRMVQDGAVTTSSLLCWTGRQSGSAFFRQSAGE
jgi:hypothetical protein